MQMVARWLEMRDMDAYESRGDKGSETNIVG